MNYFRSKHPVLFWSGAGLLALALTVLSGYLFTAYVLPLPDTVAEYKPSATTKIYDRNGILLYEILQPQSGKNTYVSIEDIPKNFLQATLAAEDVNFYSHPGVDLWAIARAFLFNIRDQRITSGASTIPQQLVRNMLGTNRERSYGEKAIEALYSIRLSHLYSKDQILELYLNRIYYGNLSYGSQAAALDYFGKPLKNLDLAQSAFLAGLPQRPSEYNPFLYFDRAKKRQKYVLSQMVKYSFITQEEALAAEKEPLTLRKNIVHMKAPHFVHYVINELGNYVDSQLITRGGFSVYTTLDYSLQQAGEEIVSRRVESLNDKNVTNGALLSIDPQTGQILTWVGSKDYFDEDIDGAVDIITSLRQPGSSIKPLTYLLALEKGYTPATILADIPTEFSTPTGPYAPKNYDLTFHGPVRLRNALASSFNIPAVKVLDYVGLESFLLFLKKLGIETLNQNPDFYGLSVTLGGGDIRMIDLAGAYNVIANYGVKKDLSSIMEIRDQGKAVYSWQKPEEQYVLGPFGKEHAYQIIDILKDPLARLGGFGSGSVLELSREAAVKTGTTRNFRDNWTVGFTPQLLTAVWVGNADASPMMDMSGVAGAGPIWHDFMEAASSFLPKVDFRKPPMLKQVEICGISGKLPTAQCPERALEWFVPGSEPKENDTYYQTFWLHKASGRIIQEACKNDYPAGDLEQKIFVVYPTEFQKWAQQNGFSLPPMESCFKNKATSDYPSDYSSDYPDHRGGLQKNNSLPVLTESPHPKDEYLLERTLPLEDQKIPFRVSAPYNTEKVKYYVDGKLAGESKEAPFSFLWLPEKGRHVMQAEVFLMDGKSYKGEEIGFLVK